MDLHNSLLAYLNIDESILGLKLYHEKLLKKKPKSVLLKPSLEKLQALLDYNEEISMVEMQITQRLNDKQKYKDAIEAGLKASGLQPDVKIPFLLIDEETTAHFYLSGDFELCIDL